MSTTSECSSNTKKKGDKDPDAEWKDKVLEKQQMFYEYLGDRTFDLIKPHQRKELEFKVGFALFGNSMEDDEENPFNAESTKEIKKITDLIYKISESLSVFIACLFIVGKTKEEIILVPVFKILKPDVSTVFLDRHLRQYNSWELFVKNNQLPQGDFGYPKDGIYQGDNNGRVLLMFGPSPNNKCGSKIIRVIDKLTTVSSFGSPLIALAVPPAAPFALGAAVVCGIYGSIKGSVSIHDRRMHKQTISVLNSEGRNCWLYTIGSIVGTVGGVGSARLVQLTTKGKEMSKIGQYVVNALTAGSVVVSGVGLGEDFVYLLGKFNKGNLTKLDVVKFCVSVLFFANIVVNTKTAKSIIEQTRKEYLSSFKSDLSKRRMKAYQKVVNKSGGDTSVKGKTIIIKAIQNSDSKDDFFRRLIKSQKKSSSTVINDNGYLVVGGKLNVTKEVLQHVRSNKSNFGLDVKSTPILNEIAETTAHNLPKLKVTADNFRELTECFMYIENLKIKDSITFIDFLTIYKKMRLKEMEKDYEEKKRIEKELMGEVFDESVFDKELGIQDAHNKRKWFQDVIEKEVEESNKDLKEKYDSSIEEITVINEDGGLKFQTNLQAVNNFFHSFRIDGEELCPQEFFEIIRLVVDNKDNYELTECDDGKIYSDTTIPLYVKIVEIEEACFLGSVSFVSIDEIFE